ncbi:MAG TPA: hypothetical protein VFQ77_16205 [Pseudonocardiaceae bacterium]|jgi:hypothetical protein|nr:hypothetical protein [Pseudonocardiaceae bacterium]
MIVDCDRCAVRGNACGDCVITVLLGAPPGGLHLDRADWSALDTLATAGMVPRLQLVECEDAGEARQISARVADPHCAERSVPEAQRPDRQVG